MEKRILCLHQGAELYGSDRSFLSALSCICDDASVDVVLPGDGPLVGLCRSLGVRIIFRDGGVLRKGRLNRPFGFAREIIGGALRYAKLYNSYDVIYINTVVMISAILAAFVTRKRVICHVREIPTWGLRMTLKAIFFFADLELVYNSYATKSAFGLRGTVIHNGVEERGVCEASPHSESGLKSNLLILGRINSWKGHRLLLEAMLLMPLEVRDEMRLRIVGGVFRGNEHFIEELEKFVQGNGLGDQVEFVPFCEDPSTHFRWCDYVVVPSTLAEPFGRVAIEAFASSRPVIAANHGGLCEIVEDGESGFLFRPRDRHSLAEALSRALRLQPGAYRRICLNARGTFEQMFSLVRYQQRIRATLFNEGQ